MTYAPELDDLRQEVRAATASTLYFWPKIDAAGNVAASATASDNTYEVRDPSGAVVQAATNAATSLHFGRTRLDLAIPAIATMAEDYFALISWREAATTFTYQERVYFDIVTEPWGPSSVSLSSLQSLVPDVADRLGRQGQRLGQDAAARASILGHSARIELGQWVRQAVTEDTSRMVPIISDQLVSQGDASSYLRPRLIKDKSRLHNVEVKLALHLAFVGDMRADSDDGDPVATLAAYWLDAAKQSFKSMTPLKYDLDDNGTVDTEIADVGRFVIQRRVQS